MKLGELTAKLNKTVVSYGKEKARRSVAGKLSAGTSGPASATADRTALLSKSKKVVTGKGDLIADLEEGTVDPKTLKDEDLPDELKKLSPKQREAYLKKKAEERKVIQAKIAKLVEKRDKYLKEKMAKRSKDGKNDAFDDQVGRIIHEQAARKR